VFTQPPSDTWSCRNETREATVAASVAGALSNRS
jgi:hypothetical protein